MFSNVISNWKAPLVFSSVITEPLLRDEVAEDFLWEIINPILVEGLTLVK